jgi:hypothetical protein
MVSEPPVAHAAHVFANCFCAAGVNENSRSGFEPKRLA